MERLDRELDCLAVNGGDEFPYLTTVNGDVSINADCKLPKLTKVGGDLYIRANCKLPKLARVDGCWMFHNGINPMK